MFPSITSWLEDTIRNSGLELLDYSDVVLDIPYYWQVHSQYTGFKKAHWS